jgi:hypothetical protein
MIEGTARFEINDATYLRPPSQSFRPSDTASICVTYLLAVVASFSPGTRGTGSATERFFLQFFVETRVTQLKFLVVELHEM